MTNFEAVYQSLLKGDLSVMTSGVILDMNNATMGIIECPPCHRSDMMLHDCEQIILISNLIYNNTDKAMLPLEDETYDKLQVIYKEAFPNSYSIGAPPVNFNQTGENILEVKPKIRLFNPRDFKKKDMMFADTFLQPLSFKDPVVIDANPGEQRRRTVQHLHPQLAGTLDKCTWVTVEDARQCNPDLIKDPNVKIFERDFIRKNANYLPMQFGIVCMLKYDGVAIEAECTDRIVGARTRGDTSADQTTDVTSIFANYRFPKARCLFGDSEDDPRRNKPVAIQFEAIIDQLALNTINQTLGTNYVNGRTAISGIIGRNDAARFVNFITLVPVDCEMNEMKTVRLEFLNTYYASIPCIYQYFYGTIDEILYGVRRFHQEASMMRPTLPFMYDGIVTEFTDLPIVNMLGRKNSVNQYMMAIKFMPLSKYTRFLGYTFSVGQNGMITPILHYLPVTLMGTTHTKTTGHSYKRFMELGLREGDIIEITYRNDVIPYASKPNIPDNAYNHNPMIAFPCTCPECGMPIEFYGDSAACVNGNCPGRLLARITAMIAKLGIKDISEERVKALGIVSFTDLMTLDTNRVYKAIGEANGNKLIDQINKIITEPIEDYKILGSLGFTSLAHKTWKLILEVLSPSDIVNMPDDAIYHSLINVKGLGKQTIAVIINERRIFAQDLMYIVNMSNLILSIGNGPKEGCIRICMTSLRDSDGSIARAISQFTTNFELTDGSVTKKTKMLLVPYNGFSSNKTKSAVKYGIPCVPVGDFLTNVRSYI